MEETEQPIAAPDSKAEEKKDSGEVPEANAAETENLSESDITYKWVTGRARTAFSFLKATALRKSLEAEEIKTVVDEYISKSEYKTLFFWLDRSSIGRSSRGPEDPRPSGQ